jgi:hypothetical protein
MLTHVEINQKPDELNQPAANTPIRQYANTDFLCKK